MSTVSLSNVHAIVNSRKRPNHPSPVPSYRTTQDRHPHSQTALKRARWDVSSPSPSPPMLSMPAQAQKQSFAFASSASAFQFGFSSPPSNAGRSTHSNHRSKRQRGSIGAQDTHSHKSFSFGSGSGEPMIINDEDDLLSASDRNVAFEHLRQSTFEEAELFVTRMREWEARSSSPSPSSGSHRHYSHPHPPRPTSQSGDATSPPYMSNSITSSSGSGSTSDASSSSMAKRRKRSWSIVEDEDEERMEWEIVEPSARAAIHIPLVTCNKKFDDMEMAMESTSAHGDDEKEDDDDVPDSEDDDEPIFILGDTSAATATAPACKQQPVATEHAISDLAQVLAAGAGALEDYVDVGAAASAGSADSDAGALWH